MKPQELRIGNYVNDTDGNGMYQVLEIYKETVRVVDQKGEDYVIHINNIQPIPLTEDFLLKLCFTRLDYGFSILITSNNESGTNLVISLPSGSCSIENYNHLHSDHSNEIYLTTLKYIHQVQNILLDLKG